VDEEDLLQIGLIEPGLLVPNPTSKQVVTACKLKTSLGQKINTLVIEVPILENYWK
jgi:hypothetical protein